MTVTLDAELKVALPSGMAPLSPGEKFEVFYDEEEDEFILRRARIGGRTWVDVMEECPEPIDDLPPRSQEYHRPKL